MAVFLIDDMEGLAAKRPVFLVDSDLEGLGGARYKFDGFGYIAGPAPTDHLKNPDGTPAADCKMELYSQGVLVAETRTGPDGSWRFDNLDHTLQYDVVAHHPTLESIISTKRFPSITPVHARVVATFTNPTVISYHCMLTGGFGSGSYAATDLSSSPNVSLTVKERFLQVNINRTVSDEEYQIQVESSGVVQPFVINLTSPAL